LLSLATKRNDTFPDTHRAPLLQARLLLVARVRNLLAKKKSPNVIEREMEKEGGVLLLLEMG